MAAKKKTPTKPKNDQKMPMKGKMPMSQNQMNDMMNDPAKKKKTPKKKGGK